MPKATLTQKSRLPELKRALQELVKKEVMVGWSDKGPKRQAVAHDYTLNKKGKVVKAGPKSKPYVGGDADISNAELAFIHTNGSPLKGIPARPILQPALSADENRKLITDSLAKGYKMLADGHPDQAERQLKRTGVLAENIVKRWFTDSRNNWAPNAASTIAAKRSSKPLIDSGQLRASVISIIRDKKEK